MKKNTPNYPVHLFSVQTNSGYEWVARYPDILGCVGGGDTPEEALAEAKINLEVYLESLDEDDLPYPNISSNEMYSANGKIALRISKDLHTKLKKATVAKPVEDTKPIVEEPKTDVKTEIKETLLKLNELIEKL